MHVWGPVPENLHAAAKSTGSTDIYVLHVNPEHLRNLTMLCVSMCLFGTIQDFSG